MENTPADAVLFELDFHLFFLLSEVLLELFLKPKAVCFVFLRDAQAVSSTIKENS